MLAVETSLQNAQKVKEYLTRHNLLNFDYLPIKEFDVIYFPILKKAKIPHAIIVDTKFPFPQKKHDLTVEEVLKDKLTKEEMKILPKSQEVVGDILILEISAELQKKEKLIAQAYLKTHKSIKTVVKKDHVHEGEFRLRRVKVLAGENRKETIHQENGVKIKLHLEKTYFSARSATERLRIAKLVKLGEKVLVMFSGAAPYPLVIAKHSQASMVYGIEINPEAHQFALESVDLNHLENRVKIFEGDVREIMPTMKESFDRIAMPLPKTGEEFLDVALPKVKKGGMIHLYAFLAEDEIPTHKKYVQSICKKLGYQIKILKTVKCGQFSPRVFRICFDIIVQSRLGLQSSLW